MAMATAGLLDLAHHGDDREALALADKMSAAWMAFARTGTPNTAGLPEWPAYSAESRKTMIFNNESRVVTDPESELRVIMEEVLGLG